jgi:hypothetical protein
VYFVEQQKATKQTRQHTSQQHLIAQRTTNLRFIDRCFANQLTMASRALTPLLRRSVVHARTKALRGGASPPLPAFARIPAPSEPVSFIIYWRCLSSCY